MDLSHFSRPPCPPQGSPVGETEVLVPPQPPMRRCRGCCSQTATGFDRALCSHAGVAVRGWPCGGGRAGGRVAPGWQRSQSSADSWAEGGAAPRSCPSLGPRISSSVRSAPHAFPVPREVKQRAPELWAGMRVVLGRALRLKELLVSRHRSFLASAADPHRAEPATRCRGCSRVVSCSVYPVLSVCFAS